MMIEEMRNTEGMGALFDLTDMLGATSSRASKRSRAPVSYIPDERFNRRFGKGYDGWAIPGSGAYVRGSLKGTPYGRVVEAHELYEMLYPNMNHTKLHRMALSELADTDPEAYKAGLRDIRYKMRYGGPEGRTLARSVLGRGMENVGDEFDPKNHRSLVPDLCEAIPYWFGLGSLYHTIRDYSTDLKKSAFGGMYKTFDKVRNGDEKILLPEHVPGSHKRAEEYRKWKEAVRKMETQKDSS